MIKLTHSLRNEVYFTVLFSFVPELREKIAQLLSGTISDVSIPAIVEPKVLKRKGESIETPLFLLLSDDESMGIEEDRLILKLDIDSLELLNDLLEGILDGELVSPEITDIYAKEWKKEKGLAIAVLQN